MKRISMLILILSSCMINLQKDMKETPLLYLKFMHGEIREENDHVFFHPNDEPSVTLIAASNHFDMVTLVEVFLELVSQKLKLILEVIVLGKDANFAAINTSDGTHQVHQFTIYYLHIVTGSKAMALIFSC